MILHIYADYDKRPGACKVQYILKRDYGINISVGRVYRLMRSMELPQMSTIKPKPGCLRTDNGVCANHLQQFSRDSPNLVRVSDITCLKAGGKRYYLCVVIDLFCSQEKWYPGICPAKRMSPLSWPLFKKPVKAETRPMALCSTPRPWNTVYGICIPSAFGFSERGAVFFQKRLSLRQCCLQVLFQVFKAGRNQPEDIQYF